MNLLWLFQLKYSCRLAQVWIWIFRRENQQNCSLSTRKNCHVTNMLYLKWMLFNLLFTEWLKARWPFLKSIKCKNSEKRSIFSTRNISLCKKPYSKRILRRSRGQIKKNYTSLLFLLWGVTCVDNADYWTSNWQLHEWVRRSASCLD